MIHSYTKVLMGFSPDTPDSMVKEFCDDFMRTRYKPCFDLDWCPYGPLVEQMPLTGADLAAEGWPTDRNHVGCEVFGHICPAYLVAEPFVDPSCCETVPEGFVDCKECTVTECKRKDGAAE